MRCNKCGFESEIDFAHACMTDKEFEQYVRSTHTAHEFKEIESLKQQLAECESELADQKLLCVDDEMVVDLPAGFKHRIKFQCDMLPLTDAEFDDYTKSPFGIKNWIRKQLDRLAECERELDRCTVAIINAGNRETDWKNELASVTKDAERYRLLRKGQHWSTINGIGDTLRADQLDAAIDEALAKLGADKKGGGS